MIIVLHGEVEAENWTVKSNLTIYISKLKLSFMYAEHKCWMGVWFLEQLKHDATLAWGWRYRGCSCFLKERLTFLKCCSCMKLWR